MNLGKQIHTLLKRQAEVYVKGLGVFKRIHTPATFDSAKRVFLPPISYIEFDSVSSQGYDFISYYQQSNQINRDEAEQSLDAAVSLLKAELDTAGQANLDNLGQLIAYGKSWVFKPLDLSGFYLGQVEASFDHTVAVSPIDEVKEVIAVPPMADLPEPEGQEDTVQMPVAESEDVADENKGTSSGGRSFIYGLIAALAVLLLAALYYYNQYYHVDSSPKQSGLLDTSVRMLDTTAVNLDTANYMTGKDSLALDQDTLVRPATVQEEVKPVLDNHPYAIIIGSHKSMKQAHQEVEHYHGKGYATVRLLDKDVNASWKRVIYDTYLTARERDSVLRYVQKNIKEDAIPYTIK